MGQTLNKLSQGTFSSDPIFKSRFVVEICEKVHVHYRNVRFVNTLHDWVSIAEGYKDALERWKQRGCPGTGKDIHIELTRKNIVAELENKNIQINLNKNLYLENEGRIFSEGANFKEPQYIHMKIGDIRIELSLSQFEEFSNAIIDAKNSLSCSNV